MSRGLRTAAGVVSIKAVMLICSIKYPSTIYTSIEKSFSNGTYVKVNLIPHFIYMPRAKLKSNSWGEFTIL